MTQQKLWLGTALVGLMIGISSPAGAQQYFTRFQPSDKPPVEVDMGVLDPSRVQLDPPVLKPARTRVADYTYLRSSDVGNTPDAAAPAAAPETPAVAAEPATAPKKPAAKKTANTHSKTKKPILVTEEPAPGIVMHPAPVQGPIISQPPTMESAAPVTEHHDIGATGAIISSPPDAPAKPAVQENMMAAPAVAEQHPMSAPPPETISEQDLMRDAAPVAPVHAPAHARAPAPVSVPHVANRPSLTISPPPAMPAETTEERPMASPLPDIKVVHEADNPDVSDPAPVAQPTVPRTPREEPLTLPKAGKIGKTTAPMLVPAPDLHTSESIPLAPPSTAAPGISNEPAAAAITPAFTQPAAVPTPDSTSVVPDMPTVPTIADLSLGFSGNSSDLTAETQKKLDAVIHQMNEMTDGRLQVRGYATGEDGSTSSARRIALSRALSVRSYLMDKGIKPTRVDVRALGTETERSPLDRVDLIFVR